MTDNTLRVWEVCKHGHAWGCYSKDCEGGREIVLFETTFLSVVAEPGHFSGMRIFVTEVSDD